MNATQIAMMLTRASAQLSKSVGSALQTGLDNYCRENVRPDVTASYETRERIYTGATISGWPIADVVHRFERFAEEQLSDWRKTAAFAQADGTLVTEYTRRITPMLRLHPLSWSGGQVEAANLRRGRGRLEARVPFHYRTRFELRRIPFGGTGLSYHTAELADPDLSCGYDLVRDFDVPRLPGGFGRVGERFLQRCAL
jgi:hypothetical protein